MTQTIAQIVCGASLAAAGLASAAAPALFGKSQPGLWELSGMQGAKVPVRLCLANLSELARIEHRGRACKQRTIRDTAHWVTFTYESERRACSYADRLLKGAVPSDLPVEEVSTLRLRVDLRIAKAMGITIPDSVLAREDEGVR